MIFRRAGIGIALTGLAAICATPLPRAGEAAGSDSGSQRPLVLKPASGHIPPLEDAAMAPPGWYRGSLRPLSAAGRRYLVAMTRGPLDERERAALESSGAAILGYIPENGYRVRLSPHDEERVRALPFIAWLGTLPVTSRVQAGLAARAGRIATKAGDELDLRIRVLLHSDEPETGALAALKGSQSIAAPSGKDGAWRIEATVGAVRLDEVLSAILDLPEVEAIEEVRRMTWHNQDGVWVHQSFVGPAPGNTPVFDEGIFGCGQVIAVSDSGQDFDSCQFRDDALGDPPVATCVSPPCPPASPNLSQRKDIIYYQWSPTPLGDDDTCPATLGASGHGTHTSGSAAGDRAPFANCSTFATPGRDAADGQAPGAKIVFQELGDGLEFLTTLGGTLWNLADVAWRSGARIQSFSFGGVCHDALGACDPSCTLSYDSLARDADLAMWSYPDLLLVASVANARGLCAPPNVVSTPAIAKSLIGAGSVGHGTAASTPSSFSSDGPVFDGRLKPTLAAQGEAVISAASDASPITDNCGTCPLDGTSMAAPTTAGLAALAREYYTGGFLAAGVRSPSSGFAPSGALLKATLIDGAVALGAAAPAPDYLSGYGRILLGGTLAFVGSPFSLKVDDYKAGVTMGSVVNHAYDVSAGTALRATLVWSDPPADLAASPARVNELKLEAIDPGGDVWFQTRDPNTGLPVMTSDPGDPHDDANVEERLVFGAPAPGRWVFRVRGVNVPMGPQPFALVVHGDAADCPAPASPASVTVSPVGPNRLDVSWSAVTGAAAYNVYRSFGSCPGGPWIPVATAVTATSFEDTGVSGDVTYSYRVTAASDAGAFCESPPSACDEGETTGNCFLPPLFDGIAAATDGGQSACSVALSWPPAAPRCGTGVVYNVYRETFGGFTPGASNRIARCVPGTSFLDGVDLAAGTTYHYVVRAEDETSGHGGPCHGGNEEANVEKDSAAPHGPPVSGTLRDDGGDTAPVVFSPAGSWAVSPTGGNTGPKVHVGEAGVSDCSDLTSPVISLGTPAPQLSFSTVHDLAYDPNGFFGSGGSLGQVEIAPGPSFTSWTRLGVSPGYPTQVDFPLNVCTSTAAATTYFSATDLAYSTYTASLTPWAGSSVKLRFHLSTDFIYSFGTWSVDDIEVSPALIPGSCATAGAGPPPIPDGASVPGAPLEADLSGPNLQLTWDAVSCPASAVNVYWGSLGNFTTFTGGACGLSPSGSATLPVPNNSWVLVVATDGAATDGSWSRDGAGNEKSYAGASAVCPAITMHVTNNACP